MPVAFSPSSWFGIAKCDISFEERDKAEAAGFFGG